MRGTPRVVVGGRGTALRGPGGHIVTARIEWVVFLFHAVRRCLGTAMQIDHRQLSRHALHIWRRAAGGQQRGQDDNGYSGSDIRWDHRP